MPPLERLARTLGLPTTITDVHRDNTGVWWLVTQSYGAVAIGGDRQVRDPAALTDKLCYLGRFQHPRLSHGAARRALGLLRQL